MKNIVKLLGIIALVALIGLGMAACKTDGDGDDAFAGTWSFTAETDGGSYSVSIVAANGKWTMSYPDQETGNPTTQSGTYTVSGNTVTLTPTTGPAFTGTISGNKFTFKIGEYETILTKQ